MTPGARSERRWRPRGKEGGVNPRFVTVEPISVWTFATVPTDGVVASVIEGVGVPPVAIKSPLGSTCIRLLRASVERAGFMVIVVQLLAPERQQAAQASTRRPSGRTRTYPTLFGGIGYQ